MTTRRARPRFGKRVAAVCLLAAAAAAIGFAVFRAPNFVGSAWRLARGGAAYTRGEWAESARVAREVLKNDPENQGALLLLARSFARSGRDDLALDVYRRVKPGALEARDYLLIGDGNSKLGPELQAVSAWLNAERLAPNDPGALARLVSFYDKADMPIEALPRARKLANDPKLGLRGTWIEARSFSELDEPESASEPLERVLKADDSSLQAIGTNRAEVASLAARVNLRLGRPERALEILDLGSAAEPVRESRWLASRALLQQGKAGDAASVLATVVPPESPMRREPAPYTGAVSCRSCHPSNYKAQQSSQHALTFHDRWDGPTASAHGGEITDPGSRRVHHRLTNDDGTTSLETTVVDRTYRAIVQYVVGSGHHGETLMLKDEHGKLRESRVSYQPKRGVWSKTIDHPDTPSDALGYLGRPVSLDASWKCVHCHTTTASAALSPSPNRPRDRGIGCERCHGPGGNHIKAVELGFSDLAIVTPSTATAAEVTNLCAECHREPAPGAFAGSPSFIRFQAPNFVKSRCYIESGSFSCVTCHNPHENAATSPAVYEAVCLQCHSPAKAAAPPPRQAAGNAKAGAICPVNPAQACLSCHMPKVPKAVPNAEFTDHYIRVRKDSTPAAPRTARRE